MFKIGDRVICIKEPETTKFLKYGEVYTIVDCFNTNVLDNQIVQFKEIPKTSFSADRFKNVIEFRKEKIQKIKERICSK